MNIKLTTISLLLSVILLVAPTAAATPVLDSAQYIVNGDIGEVNALKLKLNYQIDKINSFEPTFTYHEEEIKLQGTWKINFLKSHSQFSTLNLDLSLATPVKNISLDPAIGLSGELKYTAKNKINWQLDYYFNKPGKKWVYHGGITLPLASNNKLLLGIGNSYWYMNETIFDLGLKLEL
jgi:hypothetical protein